MLNKLTKRPFERPSLFKKKKKKKKQQQNTIKQQQQKTMFNKLKNWCASSWLTTGLIIYMIILLVNDYVFLHS